MDSSGLCERKVGLMRTLPNTKTFLKFMREIEISLCSLSPSISQFMYNAIIRL